MHAPMREAYCSRLLTVCCSEHASAMQQAADAYAAATAVTGLDPQVEAKLRADMERAQAALAEASRARALAREARRAAEAAKKRAAEQVGVAGVVIVIEGDTLLLDSKQGARCSFLLGFYRACLLPGPQLRSGVLRGVLGGGSSLWNRAAGGRSPAACLHVHGTLCCRRSWLAHSSEARQRSRGSKVKGQGKALAQGRRTWMRRQRSGSTSRRGRRLARPGRRQLRWVAGMSISGISMGI